LDKSLVTITYKTASGSKIRVEVSTPVKELLEQSDRQIRSQRRQDRRHLDFAAQADEDLLESLLPAYKDTADLLEIIERDTRLHKAIGQLTEIQRRRLYLHFFEGLSYRQIAELEGVTHRTVISTIENSLNRLRKLFQD
jgi:RNA polymerase sigma factor (sigma-70 family)